MASIHVAERVRRIKPSPSTSAADRANQLRREGRSIVNLVVGEPDFDTPAPHPRRPRHARWTRARRATRSLAGTLELRAGDRRQARSARTASPTTSDEIIVTNGAKSAIYSASRRDARSRATRSSSRRPTGSPTPTWCSPATACRSPVACPEAQGFKLTPAQLEAAITPRTRWLILNSPSNPTGATYTADEYRALAEVLAAPSRTSW